MPRPPHNLDSAITGLQQERQKDENKYAGKLKELYKKRPSDKPDLRFIPEGSLPTNKLKRRLTEIQEKVQEDWEYTKEMLSWKTELMKLNLKQLNDDYYHIEQRLLTDAGREELQREWTKKKLGWAKSRKSLQDRLQERLSKEVRGAKEEVVSRGKTLKRKVTRADVHLKDKWAKEGSVYFAGLEHDPELKDISWDQFWVEYKAAMREVMEEQKALQNKAKKNATNLRKFSESQISRVKTLRIAPNRTIHYDSQTTQRHITGTDPMDYLYREMLIYMEPGFDNVIRSGPAVRGIHSGGHLTFDTPEKRLLYLADMMNTIKREIWNIPIDNFLQIPEQGLLVRWYVAHTLNQDKFGKLLYKTNANPLRVYKSGKKIVKTPSDESENESTGDEETDNVAQSSKSKKMKKIEAHAKAMGNRYWYSVGNPDKKYDKLLPRHPDSDSGEDYVSDAEHDEFYGVADPEEYVKELKFQKRAGKSKKERDLSAKCSLAVRPSIYKASIGKWPRQIQNNLCGVEGNLAAYARLPFILGMNETEGPVIDRNDYFYYHRVGQDPLQMTQVREAVHEDVPKEQTKNCVSDFKVFADDLKEILNISDIVEEEIQAAALKKYINNHKYLINSEVPQLDFELHWVGQLIAEKGAEMRKLFFAEVRSGMTVYDWPTWSLLHYHPKTDKGKLTHKSLKQINKILSTEQFQQLDPNSTSYVHVTAIKSIGKELWNTVFHDKIRANPNKKQKTLKRN